MHAIITVGVSASGKSTFANQKVKEAYVLVERDQIRTQLVEEERGEKITGSLWQHYKFTKAREDRVTVIHDQMISDAANAGKNLIISETNLNLGRLQNLSKSLEAMGYTVDIEVFKISLRDAIKRDLHRTHSVGHEVIHSQWKKWLTFGEEITGIYQYVPDTSLPTAVIVDIDGTLAHVQKGPDGTKRDIYDYTRAGEDAFDHIVGAMVKGLHDAGHAIVIMSGRDDIGKEVLIGWLDVNQVPYVEVNMRVTGDKRADREAKLDMFKDVITRYNVIAAIDDRDSVLELWSDIGVKTIDVGHRYDHF